MIKILLLLQSQTILYGLSSNGVYRRTWPVHSSPCFPSHSSRFSLGTRQSGLPAANHDSHALQHFKTESKRAISRSASRGNRSDHKKKCEPGTHNVSPSGSILKLFQCFWQGKQILMQVMFLPNTMKTFKTEYIRPHDSLLIDNDLRKQPVPAGHHNGHSAS